MLVSIVLQLPHVDRRLLTREEGARICKSNPAISALPQRAGEDEVHVIQTTALGRGKARESGRADLGGTCDQSQP